jgi:hypothetical protein
VERVADHLRPGLTPAPDLGLEEHHRLAGDDAVDHGGADDVAIAMADGR